MGIQKTYLPNMFNLKCFYIGFGIAAAVFILFYAEAFLAVVEIKQYAYIRKNLSMHQGFVTAMNTTDNFAEEMEPNAPRFLGYSIRTSSRNQPVPAPPNITVVSQVDEVDQEWDKLVNELEPIISTTSTPGPRTSPTLLKFIHYKGSTFSMDGQGICTDNTHMVILIQSDPKHHLLRMVMRQTWASLHHTQKFLGEELSQEVKIGYIFGETSDPIVMAKIMEESKQFNDVIISEFHDSYRNLTLKTLASMEWVNKYCPSARYFVKCDDDTMVNVVNLLQLLQINPISGGMAGALVKGHHVQRLGRWAVDPVLYPDDTYPPYFSGPAYVINTDIISSLIQAAMTTPVIPIEDAYVTGILAQLVGVTRFMSRGFATTFRPAPRACVVRSKRFYTGSSITAAYLTYLYATLTSSEHSC